MRTPFGAPYEMATIPNKGRGVIASRDIKAGEVILSDTPVLVLPHETTNIILFLTLPRKALEAILLLHNHKPDMKPYSSQYDIPMHRLMDQLQGTVDTNCFATHGAACGSIGVVSLLSLSFIVCSSKLAALEAANFVCC